MFLNPPSLPELRMWAQVKCSHRKPSSASIGRLHDLQISFEDHESGRRYRCLPFPLYSYLLYVFCTRTNLCYRLTMYRRVHILQASVGWGVGGWRSLTYCTSAAAGQLFFFPPLNLDICLNVWNITNSKTLFVRKFSNMLLKLYNTQKI